MKTFSFFNSENSQNKTVAEFCNRYMESLSVWFGEKINIMEDFDVICQCELDFIEILLLGEHEFASNLLENSPEHKDFSKIKDFIEWAENRPAPTN